MNPDRCPRLEALKGDDGHPCWQITGLGMSTRHRQLWQVETHWEAMLMARGLTRHDCPSLPRLTSVGPAQAPGG